MNRDQLKDEARAAIVKVAPELAVVIAEKLVEAPVMQRWFDEIERKRPRGIVARFRRRFGRVFGKDGSGLSDEQREVLERAIEKTLEKYPR